MGIVGEVVTIDEREALRVVVEFGEEVQCGRMVALFGEDEVKVWKGDGVECLGEIIKGQVGVLVGGEVSHDVEEVVLGSMVGPESLLGAVQKVE